MITEISKSSFSEGATADDVRGLLPSFLSIDPTGSRVICPAALLDGTRDFDFIVLVESMGGTADYLVSLGFEPASSMSHDAAGNVFISEGQKFVSLKSGLLNIIVVEDRKFYDSFVLATRVAMRLGLNSKQDRIVLFQAMLYGNG